MADTTTPETPEGPAMTAGLMGLAIPPAPLADAPTAPAPAFIGLEPDDFRVPGGAFINAERLAVREDF